VAKLAVLGRYLRYNKGMDGLVSQIIENLAVVRAKIAIAARSARRDPVQVRLLVVSKAQTKEVVQAAYQAGLRCFGENYPQEAEAKIEQMADLPGLEWHMIGHLQSRKAPVVARCFQMIHSIDSLSLAEKLNRALAVEAKTLPALLEINVGGEASKFGWSGTKEEEWPEFLPDFEKILTLPFLKIVGLMTMPPLFENAEDARPYFRQLRRLREWLSTTLPSGNWQELSMGTSADYEIAIQEGATIVRIGQAILGPRPLKI
jgi:PLP dependent protein